MAHPSAVDHVMLERPATRRLRILAFDPSLATRFETAMVNEITVEIPWEEDLQEGPIGEYIEVIDVDPTCNAFYRPVDLDAPYLLAQDGLTAVGVEPAVPPGNGLRCRNGHDSQVRARARKTRALGRSAIPDQRRQVLQSVRSTAENLPARIARPERLLQPGKESTALRLLSRHGNGRQQYARYNRLHLPLP